jgi:hypothetical protein
MNRTKQTMDDSIWYVFVGCLLVGFGLGIALGGAVAGLIIGAGVGFLAMVAAPFLRK